MLTAPGTPDDPARELRRVVDRLVTLGPDRLDRAGPDGDSPHQRVQAWLQETADATAGATSSPRRPVPRLRAHGLADQVVVLTRDALDVADGDPAALERLSRRLVELRRSL